MPAMYHSPRRRKSFSSNRRPQTSRYGRRRPNNKKSLFPLIIFIGIVSLILWGIVSLFSGDEMMDANAKLEVRQGVVEFAFEGEDMWTRANDGQQFLSGDRVRCTGNCEATLNILDGGSVIALAPMTEVELIKLEQWSGGDKIAEIQLKEGELWASVAADEFDNADSRFVIKAQHALVDATGSVFDLVSNKEMDHVRVLRGEVEMHAVDSYSSKKAINLTGGQEIQFDTSTTELYDNEEGSKAIESLNASFERSEWNLKNLALFRPQEAASIRHRIELEATPVEMEADKNGIDSPTILIPANGAVIPATRNAITIEGTAPADTYHIMVNGYTLTQYNSGDRKWSYFAGTKLGTLIPGENTYKVVASSRDGRISQPVELKIVYEGKLPSQQAPIEPVAEVSNFPVPVITSPALADATQAYKTNNPVLRLSGIVDAQTVAVEVNDYRLKEYKAGSTTWRYTANEAGSNFKYGDNTFTVVAIGPDDKRSSASIRVILSK